MTLKEKQIIKLHEKGVHRYLWYKRNYGSRKSKRLKNGGKPLLLRWVEVGFSSLLTICFNDSMITGGNMPTPSVIVKHIWNVLGNDGILQWGMWYPLSWERILNLLA
jgi:hypothetical protein